MLLFYLQVFAKFSINFSCAQRLIDVGYFELFFLFLNSFFLFNFLLFFVASRGRFFHVDVNAVFFFFQLFCFVFLLSFIFKCLRLDRYVN